MRACPKNWDGLSQELGRNGAFRCVPCPKNWDILVSHGVVVGDAADASNRNLSVNRAKQAGRPVDTKYRTDGLPACLHVSANRQMVPMPRNGNRVVTGGSTLFFSLPKKNGEGFTW